MVTDQSGFSPVEILLAVTIFGLLVTAFVGAYLYGEESTMLSGNRVRATFIAEEGLEVALNIRDSGFANLTVGTHGLVVSGNQWIFSGSSDVNGIFTRQVSVASIDADRKSITSTVTWQQNAQRTGSVSLTTYLTNWIPPVAATCIAYATQQSYSSGVCRQNTQQCSNNGELYLSGGDSACVTTFPGDSSQDTCCVLP